MNDLCDKPNNVFKLKKFLKKEGQDLSGRRCLRGTNGKFAFSEKDRKRMWKEHMEKTMNKENAWDQKTEIGVVEVSLEEMTIAMKKIKLGKASGLSGVSMERINTSAKVGNDVMMKVCQKVLDGKGMPEDWKTNVMVPIYKGKGDVTNCGAYRRNYCSME